MNSYIIVKSDGSTIKVDSPRDINVSNGHLFLVREEPMVSYSYGEHANYQIIDSAGNNARFSFGDYYLESYRTCGVQNSFALEIHFSKENVQYSHSLFVDGRWGYTLVSLPYFDNEWNVVNPSLTVVSFINDIKTMGHEARMTIDLIKRDLYNARRDLANMEETEDRLRTICRGAETISIPEGVECINGDMFDDCSLVRKIIIPSSVDSIVCSAFNWKPSLKEVVLRGNRVKSMLPPFPSGGLRGSGVIDTNAEFYVDSPLLEEYRNAFGWHDIASKIHPID